MDDIEAVIFGLIFIFLVFPIVLYLEWSNSGMSLKKYLRELKKDWNKRKPKDWIKSVFFNLVKNILKYL